MRSLSTAVHRFQRGRTTKGLSGYWEEYQYQDSGAAASSGNDAGTGFFSSLWSGITNLGTTYLQTEAQRKLAESLAKTQTQVGSSISVAPDGSVVKSTSQPIIASSGVDVMSYLKNPLVLLAGGVIAYKLLKKK